MKDSSIKQLDVRWFDEAPYANLNDAYKHFRRMLKSYSPWIGRDGSDGYQHHIRICTKVITGAEYNDNNQLPKCAMYLT